MAHHNVLDVISCTGCFCVGCSNDVALRLQEDSFVTSFPPGWRFMKVWETATRQDAELLVHVFRCCCSAVSTLLLLPRGAPQLLNRLTPPNPPPYHPEPVARCTCLVAALASASLCRCHFRQLCA